MKKTYERPQLVEHGDIRKMTRGIPIGPGGGGGSGTTDHSNCNSHRIP